MSTQNRRSLRLRSSNNPAVSLSLPVSKKTIQEEILSNKAESDAVKTRVPRKRGISKVDNTDLIDKESTHKEETPAKSLRTEFKSKEKDGRKDAKDVNSDSIVQSKARPRRGCVKKAVIERYDDLMSGSASSSDVTSSESEMDSDLEMEKVKAKNRQAVRKRGIKEESSHESSTDSFSEDEVDENEEEEGEREEIENEEGSNKRGRVRGRAKCSQNRGRSGKNGFTQRPKVETNQLPVKILHDREYEVDYDEMVAWEVKSVKMVRDLRELERDRANGGQIMDTVNEFIERCLKGGRMTEMDEKESIRVTHVHENELMEMNRKKKLTVAQRIKEQVEKERERLAEESGDDDEEDEWEEMELVDKEELKEGTVEVRMESKKKLNAPWKAKWIRQEVNREVRQRCENIHKAHLVSCISHLRHLMAMAKSSRSSDGGIPLSARALSLIPSTLLSVNDTADGKMEAMEEMIEWWKKNFKKIEKNKVTEGLNEVEILDEQMENHHFVTSKDATVLFSSFAEHLKIPFRIVARCEVITKKPRESNPPVKKESKTKKVGIQKEVNDKWPKEELMTYWCELWSDKENKWIVFDPFVTAEDDSGKKGKSTKQKKESVNNDENDVVSAFVKSWNSSLHIEPYRSCMEKDGPVLYLVAVDNNFGVRDVSQRYINGKDLISRELKGRRANEEWLTELWKNKGWMINNDKAKLEDAGWLKKMEKMEMPKTVAAFKDHPLYVLDKDVLKMQKIFPYDTVPIGEIGKYKIYLRKFVRPINTAKWYEKMGRQIKMDEFPCGEKQVTNPMSGETGTQGLYGYWQTEPWDGGEVTGGRIPRNEFNNVYMYQKEMVPRGCVYLEPEGLQRVAIELGKDFVPAVIAWYYKGGNTIPLIRGAVFIKEDLPELIATWRVSYRRWKEEEAKARTDRCMGRWKKLIKGMLRLAAMRKEFAPMDGGRKETTLDEEVHREEQKSWPQKKYGGEMFTNVD